MRLKISITPFFDKNAFHQKRERERERERETGNVKKLRKERRETVSCKRWSEKDRREKGERGEKDRHRVRLSRK